MSIYFSVFRSQIGHRSFLGFQSGVHSEIDELRKITLIANADSPKEQASDELVHSLSWNVYNLSWCQMDLLFLKNPDYAQQVWDELKAQAVVDFETGHFAAQLFEQTDWQKDVWKRAHFAAIFQIMVESYEPQNAMELQMVEMAAVEYFLWRH